MSSDDIVDDPYLTLGVAKDADASAIHLAYHFAVLKGEVQPARAGGISHKVKQAYELLSDPKTRAQYDNRVKLAQLRKEAMVRDAPHLPKAKMSWSTARKPTEEGPDVINLKHKSLTWELYFPPFTIGDGLVYIKDIKRLASEKLKVRPQLLRLFYKGRQLHHDDLTARGYNLKHNSEVFCVVAEDATESDAPDGERISAKDLFDVFFGMSEERRQGPGVAQPLLPGMGQPERRRKPAGFDPNMPGGDEPMAPRASAYIPHAQKQHPQFLRDGMQGGLQSMPRQQTTPLSKSRKGGIMPVQDSSLKQAETYDSAYGSSGGQTTGLAGTSPQRQPRTRHQIIENDDDSRPPALPLLETYRGTHRSISPISSPMPFVPRAGHDDKPPDLDLSGLEGEQEQQTARDQLPLPNQPRRPRSAPVTDFHSIATKAFQEDVFVWSSVTRELIPTMASVDTQSDRNLVYVGFLENDLRLEYKKYNGEATPLRTLAGSVWPLGWVMLKIFPSKINKNSGIKERQRPQYVVFDVYEMTTFGDMLLGNEYAEGNDTCNFLIKGSRKTTAQTEALRRQREEEFRRFETENGQQTQNGQNGTSTNGSMNSSANASTKQRWSRTGLETVG
jgi:hypothetical protein